MSKGKYFMSPYLVELMQNKVPFMVFYDNHQLLEGGEVSDWIEDQAINGDGLLATAEKYPYMIAHHYNGKHGSGYVLKDIRVIYDVCINDSLINQGYEAIMESFDEVEVIE